MSNVTTLLPPPKDPRDKDAVVFIGPIAVQTPSVLIAAKVLQRALKRDAVHGTITVNGKRVRYAGIAQYNHWNGFTQPRKKRLAQAAAL